MTILNPRKTHPKVYNWGCTDLNKRSPATTRVFHADISADPLFAAENALKSLNRIKEQVRKTAEKAAEASSNEDGKTKKETIRKAVDDALTGTRPNVYYKVF